MEHLKAPPIFTTTPRPHRTREYALTITLGHPLQLVLLFNSITVTAPLGSIDQLFGQTLGDALDVAESGFAGADGEQRNGLVDAAQGRNVDGLAAHRAGAADAGRVFARAAVDDGIDGDLDWVLVRHYVNLFRTREL